MALLKSTNVIGNLSATGNIIASKFILNDGNNNNLLLDGGNTKLISDFATSGEIAAANVSIDNLSKGKVNKLGDTMTGLLKTVFKESVATGSYQATATTIPTLIEEVRYSNGCMGSVSITESYTNNSITIAGSWYNFLYIPHRSGGDKGAANGDNCNYGTLFLMGMTGANGYYRIRFSNSSIAEVEKIISSSGGNIYGNLNFQGNVSPLTNDTGSIGTTNSKWNAVYATNLYGHATSASQLATNIVFTPADTALTMANVRDLIGNNSQIRRGSWSYAANGYIASGSATGQCPFGPLDLAGTTVIQANNNNSAYTQIYITPPTASTTGAIKGEMLYYIDNGTNYSPTWRRVLTNDNYDLYALPLTGGTMTGTLTLEPASGKGGQILLNAATNDQINNGIIIDTANGDFRIFGSPSRNNTSKTGYGSLFRVNPYGNDIPFIDASDYILKIKPNNITLSTSYNILVQDSSGEDATIYSTSQNNFIQDLGLSQVYNYKGTITWEDLKKISSARVGDVYYIIDIDADGHMGCNWACKKQVTTATNDEYELYWQSLGSYVNLSGYALLNSRVNSGQRQYFNGEQHMSHEQYCPTIYDIASGVGCSLKNARALNDQAIIGELLLPYSTKNMNGEIITEEDTDGGTLQKDPNICQVTAGEMGVYTIDRTNGGKITSKTFVGKFTKDGWMGNASSLYDSVSAGKLKWEGDHMLYAENRSDSKLHFGTDALYRHTSTGYLILLDAGNYNSYSPTLNGAGATGTWEIDISGNASSADSVAWANVSNRPGNASESAAGFMSSEDKKKLNGIAEQANNYSLPNATGSVLGGVKIGSNITVLNGTISLSKSNVTSALGYTPPATDTTYSAGTGLSLNGTAFSVNFANNTLYKVGDDVLFGDQDVAGAFCIKGNNGNTSLRMIGYTSGAANLIYNSSDKCIDITFN